MALLRRIDTRRIVLPGLQDGNSLADPARRERTTHIHQGLVTLQPRVASVSSSFEAPVAIICATTVSSAGLSTATTSSRVTAAMVRSSARCAPVLQPSKALGPSTMEWLPSGDVTPFTGTTPSCLQQAFGTASHFKR